MKSKKFGFTLICFAFIICLFTMPIKSFAAYTSSYSEPTILIRKGCYGSGVKWVQDMLNHNGFSLTVDGVYGNGTYSAVKSFQAQHALSSDGIVGSATKAALKKYAYTSVVTMYTTSNLNLRNGSSTQNSILLTIPKASAVQVLSKLSNGWSYVKYNNIYGYVSSSYLSNTKPQPTINTGVQALASFNRTATDLMSIIKNCKNYYANNNFSYSTANGVRSIPADKSNIANGLYTDCSCYVSWCLYEYASANNNTNMKNYFSYQRSSASFKAMGDNGGNSYLSVVSKKTANNNVDLNSAKPGDILVSPGHVEFFNSYSTNYNGHLNLKVYNCGSTSSIRVAGVTNSATKDISEITYILRVK